MSTTSEAILQAAIIDHAAEVYGPRPSMIMRSVTVAHCIIDGEEAVAVVATGMPHYWEALGLLAHAQAELSGEVAGDAARGHLSEGDEADPGPCA